MHLKTLQGGGIPAKGTTVCYLQHKAVRANSSSDSAVLTRPVRIIEALEGILVGIHKEVRTDTCLYLRIFIYEISVRFYMKVIYSYSLFESFLLSYLMCDDDI
jgi:hypothetical protein